MNKPYRLIALIPLLWLSGCSNEETTSSSDQSLIEQPQDHHLLKDQANVLQDAEALEEKMLDGMATQRDEIKKQGE